MFSNIIEIIILSLVQGISEFLPISSSSHLIIISTLYEFKTSSLLIDVSLHLGSLFSIIFFFRKELLDIKNNRNHLNSLKGKSSSEWREYATQCMVEILDHKSKV